MMAKEVDLPQVEIPAHQDRPRAGQAKASFAWGGDRAGETGGGRSRDRGPCFFPRDGSGPPEERPAEK